jgi:hypothetical protein
MKKFILLTAILLFVVSSVFSQNVSKPNIVEYTQDSQWLSVRYLNVGPPLGNLIYWSYQDPKHKQTAQMSELDKLDISTVLFILYNKGPVLLSILIALSEVVLFVITHELLFNDELQTAAPFIVVPSAFTAELLLLYDKTLPLSLQVIDDTIALGDARLLLYV